MGVPVIEQAKIQAQVLVPLLKALQSELGEERANALVRKALGDLYRRYGEAFRQRKNETNLGDIMGSAFATYAQGEALDYRVIERSRDAFDVDVTRCRYADFYKELGEPELGFLLVCSADFPTAEGIGPDIELTRTQTIMQGAGHCDFRYKRSAQSGKEQSNKRQGRSGQVDFGKPHVLTALPMSRDPGTEIPDQRLASLPAPCGKRAYHPTGGLDLAMVDSAKSPPMVSVVVMPKRPPQKAPTKLGEILYANSKAPVPEQEWAALVQSIAAGDQLALHALFDRAHRLVFTLIMRITANRETAEELTIDVFHDIWRSASRYDAANGTVLGWIMNQARSRAIDRLRFDNRKKRRAGDDVHPLAEAAADPRDVIELRQQGEALRAALTALTPGERQAIEVTFFGGLTHAEAAARLNQPLGTVKTRIRSGLHKLRKVLAAEAGKS